MARNLIVKCFKIFWPPSDKSTQNFRWWAKRIVAHEQTLERGPPSAAVEIFLYKIEEKIDMVWLGFGLVGADMARIWSS